MTACRLATLWRKLVSAACISLGHYQDPVAGLSSLGSCLPTQTSTMVRVHRLHFTSLNSINIQQNKTGQVSLLQQSKRNWRPGTGRHRSLVPHINSTSSSSYWCGVFCSAQQGMATDVCLNPLNVGMFFFYHSAITNIVTLHFGERVCSSHLLTLQMKVCGDTKQNFVNLCH